MSILVTGGTGCLGHHILSSLIRDKGEFISFSHTEPRYYRKVHNVRYLKGNLMDYKQIHRVLSDTKPTEIYHLAAQNSVALSQIRPFDTMQNNTLGTLNLLEAVRTAVPKARVNIVSSAEIYGGGKGIVDIVHPETDSAIPFSTYAASKAACELLGIQYLHAYNLDVVITRPFHYSGPLQSMRYVLPFVGAQIAKIEQDQGETVIFAGNLDVSRDYLDVRDMARGICLIAKRGNTGEVYNICSGKTRTIRDMVEFMIGLSGIPIEIRVDPAKERAHDIPLLVGSPEKIMSLTGFKPIISFEDSLKDLYVEIKNRIRAFPEESH